MGQLTFYIIEANGKLIDYNFKKKGHQGKDWFRVEISLDNPDFKKFSYRVTKTVCFIKGSPYPQHGEDHQR